jgi:hypothetical protein
VNGKRGNDVRVRRWIADLRVVMKPVRVMSPGTGAIKGVKASERLRASVREILIVECYRSAAALFAPVLCEFLLV